MSDYSDYYKDIGNSGPMNDPYTESRHNFFSVYLGDLNAKIGEYGCGPGANIAFLKQRSKELKCFDIEECLRPLIEKQGIPYGLINESQQIECPSEYFDTIYSTDVLEHVYWPRRAVKEMHRILKIGGLVLLSVPYHGLVKNLAIALMGFNRHYSPDGSHVRFFTKRTLVDMFSSEGFILIREHYIGRQKIIAANMCFVFKKLN